MSSDDLPPPIPGPAHQSTLRPVVAAFLNFALLVFLAAAFVSLASDSLIAFAGNRTLEGLAGLIAFPALLTSLAVYGLMALTPMVPKRIFLPLTLFGPLAGLLALPLLVYFYRDSAWIAWGISLGQVWVCVAMFHQLRASRKFTWPPLAVEQLGTGRFRWRGFFGFVAIHLFLVLPLVAVYLAGCGGLAVNHFTGGFVSLRPAGVTMQVRKYIRDDGKTVELVPMSHIGEPEFYHTLADSFSPTAAVLMEGVSDKGHLLETKVGYAKTAKDLGLTEQREAFKPKGELIPADVDIGQFSQPTLDLLKKTMLVHSKGITAETLPILLQPTPKELQQGLLDDLLLRRNAHLLTVLRERLLTSDNVIIPWGAAHMPGVSAGVLAAGFRLQETEDHIAIRFGKAKDE
jgi:hypothetical protein